MRGYSAADTLVSFANLEIRFVVYFSHFCRFFSFVFSCTARSTIGRMCSSFNFLYSLPLSPNTNFNLAIDFLTLPMRPTLSILVPLDFAASNSDKSMLRSFQRIHHNL